MKRLIAVLVAVAAVAAAVAVPAFAATKTVKVGPQTSFGPKSLTIKSGDTVRFQWTGSLAAQRRDHEGPEHPQGQDDRRGAHAGRRVEAVQHEGHVHDRVPDPRPAMKHDAQGVLVPGAIG